MYISDVREISLAGGKNFALVDDDDFELVSKYSWTRRIANQNNKIYVQTATLPRICMHRLIMGFPKHPLVVDHINHNGLDNRKSNLRIVTKQQNQYNRRAARNSSSKYLGVSKDKKNGLFKAQIGLGNKRTICIGIFRTEIEAAIAYNKKAFELRGEFANLNIIPD